MFSSVDLVAFHILDFLEVDAPIITSVNFYMKMPTSGFALIRYSYGEKMFTFMAEESDPSIGLPTKKFEFLRACCVYVRGTSKISIKNQLFVNGTTISIGFYEHFGELVNSISYPVIHLIYL